jgi:hypothetical protein
VDAGVTGAAGAADATGGLERAVNKARKSAAGFEVTAAEDAAAARFELMLALVFDERGASLLRNTVGATRGVRAAILIAGMT